VVTTAFTAHAGMVRVETCGGSWLIDLKRSRYCRVDRGTPVTFVAPHAWHEFRRLLVEPNGVVRLVLDGDGNSFVSAWLHTDACPRCAQGELRKPA
jgi:hypothetical protein